MSAREREADEASRHVDGSAPAAATERPAAATAEEGQQQQQQQQPDDEATPPLPPLEPLFTLLTNATTNTTVHPRVQYLFADDDSLPLSDPPPPMDRDGRPRRAVVVDLAPSADGARWTVAGAASLNRDFAVTASRLAPPAPAPDDAPPAGGPVLRVEGVDREPVDAAPPPRPDNTDALADEFRRRMAVLRKVVAEADRRRLAMVRQQELQQLHHHHHPLQPHGPRAYDAGAKHQPADDEAGRRPGPDGQG